MTAKEKVLAKYPRARHTRYKTNGGRGYTLIWSEFRGARLGEGATTAQAWSNAAKALKDDNHH